MTLISKGEMLQPIYQKHEKVFRLEHFRVCYTEDMQNNTDWLTIRAEYEAGASKQALSQKHGITRQAIIKRARKEHWVTPLVTSPQSLVTPPVTNALPIDMTELSDIEKIEKALADLYRHLAAGSLELKEHKLFADALSQYMKLKMLIPQDDQSSSYLDLREFLAACTPEELAIVNPVIKAVAARKAEQDEKVKPIRRIG